MRPLHEYVAKLRRERPDVQVPDFDPLDGGIKAQVLFLFQKAGKQTVGCNGSGFISRNNADPTAVATFTFMRAAGIPRELTITWNVVPWWDGQDKVPAPERHAGVKHLQALLELLPCLRAVVLVGGVAKEAWRSISHPELYVVSSYHPSPRGKTSEQWCAIPEEWAKVRAVLDERPISN